jgi:FHA domain
VTEHGVLPGLWPIHGDGVLARQGDLVLLIHPAGGAFTDRLLDLLADAARAGATGLRFTDMVSAEFDTDAAAADTADTADQQDPAVVAFGPAGEGTAVTVYGTGWAEVTTAHGSQRLTAGEPYGRLRCVLPSTLIKIRAGVQPVPGGGETDPYLRLADGVVRAVALLYAPAEVAAEAPDEGRYAAPAPSPAAEARPAPAAVVAPPAAAPAAPPAAPEPPAAAEPPPAAAPPAAAEPPAVVPVAVEAPAVPPVAVEPPAPVPVPVPMPDQPPQTAPEPYADHIAEPEPEYHATRIEPAVSGFPAADLYAPPASDPYAAPAPDSYAAPAPPLAPDPYAASAAADPYAEQPAPPVPGPSDGGARPDFISISLVPGEPGALGAGPGALGIDVPQRDPLPLGAEPPEAKDLGLVEMPSAQVEGVYCKNGHFNDPEARYCAVCGISMGQLTKIRQKGTRPPLGVLILGDGSVCQVDADYVIGREPTLDSAVADGRARPLRLMGASGVVSRIHARVELDGWQVYLTDLNSANGTQILMPGERNPTSLQPGVRTPLAAGAQIRLGGEYGLQYDSHRHR